MRYESKSLSAFRPLSELRQVSHIREVHGGTSIQFTEARAAVGQLIAENGLDLFMDEAAARLQALSRMPYGEFLRTEEWKQAREAALELAGHKCQVCSGDDKLQVHHRNYANVPLENLADLTVLCDGCHTVFHDNRRLRAA